MKKIKKMKKKMMKKMKKNKYIINSKKIKKNNNYSIN